MTSLLRMMSEAPRHPDWTDALEAYTAALRVRDKAHEAFEKADRAAQQREAELRAVFDRLTCRDAATAAGKEQGHA